MSALRRALFPGIASRSNQGTSKHGPSRVPGWCPPALRWWSPLTAIIVCWSLIATLQYFLHQSRVNKGILFAASVNDLPLRQTFWYLYLPTIIAVVFSIFVVWIDHDARRFEPYRQMAKAGGASGRDSLLLQYPFDFALTVPFVAFRRRHWLVFWASAATVITTLGIVPFQAGIFTTETVTRNLETGFRVSKGSIQPSLQNVAAIVNHAQSSYGILKLNESLPHYMARDYMIAPFAAVDDHHGSDDGVWTANTTSYGMNLTCDTIQPHSNRTRLGPLMTWFRVSPTCEVFLRNINNNTIGEEIGDVVANTSSKYRSYTSFFLANDGYFADREGLGTQWPCFQQSNNVILAAFVRNKSGPDEPSNNITAIVCRPSYYEQAVEATVDIQTRTPKAIVPHGVQRPIPADLFNTTVFEHTLAAGVRGEVIDYSQKERDSFMPGRNMPQYLEGLANRDLTPFQTWAAIKDLPPMSAMALTVSSRPTEDFLDPQVLGAAYESAYRLLFARTMTGFLDTNYTQSGNTSGRRVVHSEAVTLEPTFTYIVEALLAVLSVAMMVLLYFAVSRNKKSKLVDDPGSIAAVMALVADDSVLLSQFETLDCCKKRVLVEHVQHSLYSLGEAEHAGQLLADGSSFPSDTSPPSEKDDEDAFKLPHAKRPQEFRSYTAVPFVGLFAALTIVLAILFAKARGAGLPLPSQNRFVQNLVSGYLPTAIATLIEPTWILVNRLLCILQPLEELRKPKASDSRSLTLNYTSLPPPLVFFKAAYAGHLLLATVAAMALLSNVLAIGFAGLFFQDSIWVSRPIEYPTIYEPRFVAINGSSGPPVSGLPIDSNAVYSGAYQGNAGDAQFLVSESNYTRNTSLPSWADDVAMYLPFEAEHIPQAPIYQARTRYFTVAASCKRLSLGGDARIILWNDQGLNSTDPSLQNNRGEAPDEIFEVQVTGEKGDSVTCYPAPVTAPEAKPHRQADLTQWLGAASRFTENCIPGNAAAELQTNLVAATNASEYEQATCHSAIALSWMRRTNSQCPDGFNNDVESDGFEQASNDNTLLVLCQPRVLTGQATIEVDHAGVLLKPASNHILDTDEDANGTAAYVATATANLVAQSNLFISRSQRSGWHNDSFASEYIHYFVNRAAENLLLTNPDTPLPGFDDVEAPLNKAFTRLFALWLGVNKELLFEPATNSSNKIQGALLTQEQRLFFTVPMFIISETILGIYVIVSIILYIWRPGRYLPRMPTSIAAVIALFASSAAVKDLQGTSQMKAKERARHLNDLNQRYGYGSYIGSDGAVHVGIEKVPYVSYMKEVTFAGSRAEREIRKRRENRPKLSFSASVDQVSRSSEGVEDEAPVPIVRSRAVYGRAPSAAYTPLGPRDHDEYPVSPLENRPVFLPPEGLGDIEPRGNRGAGGVPASDTALSAQRTGYSRVPLDDT